MVKQLEKGFLHQWWIMLYSQYALESRILFQKTVDNHKIFGKIQLMFLSLFLLIIDSLINLNGICKDNLELNVPYQVTTQKAYP